MAGEGQLGAIMAWVQSELGITDPAQAQQIAFKILKEKIAKGGGGLPVGTVKQRKDGAYKKTAPGVWEKIKEEKQEAPKVEPKKEQPKGPEVHEFKAKGDDLGTWWVGQNEGAKASWEDHEAEKLPSKPGSWNEWKVKNLKTGETSIMTPAGIESKTLGKEVAAKGKALKVAKKADPAEAKAASDAKEAKLKEYAEKSEKEAKEHVPPSEAGLSEPLESAEIGEYVKIASGLSSISARPETWDQNELGRPPSPAEAKVLDSIVLFTDGNVASVRDPSKYDRKAAGSGLGGDPKGPRIAGQSIYTLKSPTREKYEEAHRVMTALASAPIEEERSVWRGIMLPANAIEELKSGAVFDCRTVSSWSFSSKVARGFSHAKPGYKAVVFKLPKPKRGTDVSKLSYHVQEEEFVTGGKVRVVGEGEEGGIKFIEVEHV